MRRKFEVGNRVQITGEHDAAGRYGRISELLADGYEVRIGCEYWHIHERNLELNDRMEGVAPPPTMREFVAENPELPLIVS